MNINDTSNITNNTTRPNHNKYEHNVIKKVNKHIKHTNNYDTEISDYNKKESHLIKIIIISTMIHLISERLRTSRFDSKQVLQITS